MYCHEGPMSRVLTAAVQMNPPTGAAVRSQFRQFTEASQELAHAGVDTSSMFRQATTKANAMIAANEAPILTQ